MTAWEALAVLAAGIAAGTINAIVGSGSLITFPTLLAVGYPPVTANVANNIGLVPGAVTASIGYRRELSGQRARLLRLGMASAIGGVTGALLLLMLPDEAFRAIVPALIALAALLVIVQPRVTAALALHRMPHAHGGPWLFAGVFLAGVYGGYFGAAQGILVIALLGLFFDEDLQRLNGAKNALTALVNLVAGVVFLAVAHVAWGAVLLIAAGSITGGFLGSTIGRRLPSTVLRGVIVAVSVVAIVALLR